MLYFNHAKSQRTLIALASRFKVIQGDLKVPCVPKQWLTNQGYGCFPDATPAHHHTTLSMTPPPLSLQLTAETGPNDNHIVGALGKFFYMFFDSTNLYLSFLTGFDL